MVRIMKKKKPTFDLGTCMTLCCVLIGVTWMCASLAMFVIGEPDDLGPAPEATMAPKSVKFHPASKDSFSACLFVKDENHRLIEWIAYHYHAMKLEFLVVGVDETSQTSPQSVLDRWQGKIRTELWEQSVFATPEQMAHGRVEHERNYLHLKRQQLFYKQCIRYLKEQDRSWTLFIDADEYITFNHRARTVTGPELQQDYQGIEIPSLRNKGAIYDLLKEQGKKGGSLSQPCITIPRLRFIGKDTSYTDPMGLDTLRFSAHAKRDRIEHNGLAKNMIDVSRVDLNDVDGMKNAHSMLKGVCWNPQLKNANSLFQVNHYVGSYESFNSRQDEASEYVGGPEEVSRALCYCLCEWWSASTCVNFFF
jgi:hypothetical protein